MGKPPVSSDSGPAGPSAAPAPRPHGAITPLKFSSPPPATTPRTPSFSPPAEGGAGGGPTVPAQQVSSFSPTGLTLVPLQATPIYLPQTPTTTTLTLSASQVYPGQAVTMTATVAPSGGAGAPTGTVAFFDGPSLLDTVALVQVSGGSGYEYQAALETDDLTLGLHSITAIYGGDATFAASSACHQTVAVHKLSASFQLDTSEPNYLVSGHEVTFTATFPYNSGGGPNPTGSVAFFDCLTSLGSSSINEQYQAIFTTDDLYSPENHQITAFYPGDSVFAPATATIPQIVAQNWSLTYLDLTANSGGQGYTLTASMTSGGQQGKTVAIYDGQTSRGSITLGSNLQGTMNLTLADDQGYTFSGMYEGDAVDIPSWARVSRGPISGGTGVFPTNTSGSVSPSPPNWPAPGQQVTFSVTVAGNPTPTGTVAFYDGQALLGGASLNGQGQASYSTSSLSLGGHVISILYGGDSTYYPDSTSLNTCVLKYPVTVSSLAASGAVLQVQRTLPLTATLTTPNGGGQPSGSVAFYDGPTYLGTGTISTVQGQYQAVYNDSTSVQGYHAFSALYGGATAFGSAGGTWTPDLALGTTSMSVASSVNPADPGENVTWTATVTPTWGSGTPSGTVDFYDGQDLLGSASLSPVSGGQAEAEYATTAALTAGLHNITAIYRGDGDGAFGSNAAAVLQKMMAATTTTVLDPEPLLAGQTATLVAFVDPVAPVIGTPTGTVEFQDNGQTVGTATLSGGVATVEETLSPGPHVIEAIYGGDNDFAGSQGADKPPEVPPESSCCSNPAGDLMALDFSSSGPSPTLSSSQPVRYYDGVVTLAETDLSSAGFGLPWGQTRSWTNGPGYAVGASNGSGWVATQAPHLIQADGTSNDTIIMVSNGTTARYYDLSEGVYHGRFADTAQLNYTSGGGSGGDQFTLTDSQGDQLGFFGFSSNLPAAQRGTFMSFTDPKGNLTEVTSFTGDGKEAVVEHESTVGQTTIRERYQYSYLASPDPNAGLVSGVVLQRQVDGGGWTTSRQVEYAYYNGTEDHGNLGDLKTAIVKDGSGNPLDTSYYRYYTGESGGYAHGMKYVFRPASYARLVGALGTNLSSLTDAQVAPYADNYFAYDQHHRVTEEVAQGAGCSGCGGGLGAFAFETLESGNPQGYNSWAVKTVETLPDDNQNIVYTNGFGQVMLKVFTDTHTEQSWATFYQYDDQGRLLLEANPSAITGYDENAPDLLVNQAGNYEYLRDNEGLLTRYAYFAETTAGETTPGGVAGYLEEVTIQQGELGTPVPQKSLQYFAHSPANAEGSIGDVVWVDTDQDGIQDAGEPGQGGVTVNLLDQEGSFLSSTSTDMDGSYRFSGLAAGSYIVEFVAPEAQPFTQKDQGGDDTLDSDADVSTGRTAVLTLTPGQERTDVDAGLLPGSGVIGDFVWDDTDQDGLQDAGESGHAGVTVHLLDQYGSFLSSTTTGQDGSYHFSWLPAGSYSVEFVAPEDYHFTLKDQNIDDTVDSDADVCTGRTVLFTLASGQTRTEFDAGLLPGSRTLGNLVWDDTDMDGLQDPGESGHEGVTVNLRDPYGSYLSTTSTGQDGSYLFSGLVAGSYIVEFVAPTGTQFTLQDQGGDDTLDSDAATSTGRTAVVTLGQGQDRTDIDAGLCATGAGSIGGTAWDDCDQDGNQDPWESSFAGVTVNLLDQNGSWLSSTATSSGGTYQFSGVAAGWYQVEFVAPSGFQFTSPATGRTALLALGAGQDLSEVDAGLYGPGSGGNGGSVGDYVWDDTDQDGLQESGESGHAGVTVNLLDSYGNWLYAATTGQDGSYLISGLAAGYYRLEFVAPSGTQFTLQDQGSDDTVDSDADPDTGRTGFLDLTLGQDLTDVDAGLCPESGGRGNSLVGQGPAQEDVLNNPSATVYPLATETVYRNTDGTGGQTTTYAYTWFPASTQMQFQTVTKPGIPTTQNGPGVDYPDTETTFFDNYGRPLWHKDGDGFLTYTAYDQQTGAVVKTITDVDTTQTGDFTGLPSGWCTPSGGGLHLLTQYTVDSQGRVTRVTDPNGNVTCTVYNDAAREVRTYPGWVQVSGGWQTTGPTSVSREDLAHSYSESLTMTAAPHVTNNAPDGTEEFAEIQSLSRQLYNAAGQVVEQDAYFNLTGVDYDTATYLGTENVNYYATLYGYDEQGRQDRVEQPTGTIERTVYDGQGRVISTWVGLDDTPTTGTWSPENTEGTDLVQVSENVYDEGEAGDGNLTQAIQYPGGSAPAQVAQNWYDWRNRLVATKLGVQETEDTTTHRPISYSTYDNLNQVTQTQRYDGDQVTISSSGGVPQPPSASLLRAQATTSYDEQGRVYRTQVFSVDPSTGEVSENALTTNNYYNHRGNLIAASPPGGLWTKNQYDGAGRTKVTYSTDGSGGTSWTAAGGVANDNVLSQVETQYDANGNVILAIDRERFHDETTLGALANPSTAPKARVSYKASYYDAANRSIAQVNVGTNGGSPYTRPSTVPVCSDTVLVTSFGYQADAVQQVQLTGGPTGGTFTLTFDGQTTSAIAYNASASTVQTALQALSSIGTGKALVAGGAGGPWHVRFADSLAETYQEALTGDGSGLTGGSSPSVEIAVTSFGGDSGQQQEVIDPRGLVAKTDYDLLGRVVRTIEGFSAFAPSNAADKTTEFTYDGNGHMLTLQADEPDGAFQRTQFLYGVTTATGSNLNSNDFLAVMRYPDPETGLPSASEQETYTVNALGTQKTLTDRNGNVHTYSYDILGRQTVDAVTTLGTGVDGTVRRLETGYDTQGNSYLFTSLDAASGGSVLNQVKRTFNGLGQLTAEYHSHSGVVNTQTTPVVQYGYSEMSGGANHSRQTSLTYPNGRVVNYNYSTGLNETISRLSSLSDTSATLESYLYLGLNTVVERAHPQPNVNLIYIAQDSQGNGDAGDQYVGLDRFGRVVDQHWYNPGTQTSTDRFQYGYDRDSNRLYRDNLVNSAFGELYHASGQGNGYDNLNQLTGFARGVLSASQSGGVLGTVANPSHTQSWTYDALGNWTNFTNDSSTQTRTANQQNEITSILGLTTPAYDANGNMTTDQTGKTLVYDGWNRSMAYKNGENHSGKFPVR